MKKSRLQYNYYFQGKKYSRSTLSTMVGSDSFYKHIKDYEHHPSRYTNIEKTSYGYDYTFTSGIFQGEVINIHIKKITRQKINLDRKFYALDIETSTFFNEKHVDWEYKIHNGIRESVRLTESQPVSIPYLCGIREYDIYKMIDSPVNGGYIKTMFDEQYLKGYLPLTTYQTIIDWFIQIINQADESNTVKFVVIQNNAYEHSFLHSNVYCKLPEGYKYDAHYIKPHKPLYIDLYKGDDLCVRILDTYLLTGNSIKAYGSIYGYEKLDKTDDYKSTYTPDSLLPIEEYVYNKRDLDISALMFVNVIKDLMNSCNKEVTEVLPKLFTKTGVTRLKNRWLFENQKDNLMYNKHDMLKENLNADVEVFSDCSGNKEKVKLFKFNHDCFIGGFVRANEKTVYKIQEQVKSIDITSSYPYSMKSKYYGYHYVQPDEDFDAYSFIVEWKKQAEKLQKNFNKMLYYYFNNYIMFYLSKHKPFWNASIIITDIKPKPLINDNSMLIMSTSKITDSENAYVNNGRIVFCSKAVLNVSAVELFNYCLIYDFDIYDVSYFEYATIVNPLSKSMQKTVDYYYKRKSDLKLLVQAQKEGKVLEQMDSIPELALNEYEQKYIQQHYKESDFITWLEVQLMLSKADLNAQYGINVESVEHDEIVCNDKNEYIVVSTEVEHSVFRRNFKVGMLITAWSRMHLILMSLYLINNGATIHYWDTDSIKFTTENDIDNLINIFNKKVGKFKNCEGIGTYSFEYLKGKNYSYEKFISGGSKNYWYLNNGKVNFTVSGLSSKAKPLVQQYFTENCKSDFRQFVVECLQPMTDFDGESIKTNVTDYTHQQEEVDTIVNGYHFKGFSGVIINLPQSRGLLPYPSRFIESRFFNEYGIRCKPQLLIKDEDAVVILEIKDINSKEMEGLL